MIFHDLASNPVNQRVACMWPYNVCINSEMVENATTLVLCPEIDGRIEDKNVHISIEICLLKVPFISRGYI